MPTSATGTVKDPSYDFPAKARYRRDIWEFVEDVFGDALPASQRQVLYLDSGQILETRHLLELGYSPENMICGSDNPATNANITRKFRDIPDGSRIGRWGGDVFDAVRCYPQRQAVNADLCQQLTAGLLGKIEGVARLETRPRVLAVTVACFHEHWYTLPASDDKLLEWAGRFSDGQMVGSLHDQQRVTALISAMTGNRERFKSHAVRRVKFGTYMSPTNTNAGLKMLWAAVEYAGFAEGK